MTVLICKTLCTQLTAMLMGRFKNKKLNTDSTHLVNVDTLGVDMVAEEVLESVGNLRARAQHRYPLFDTVALGVF